MLLLHSITPLLKPVKRTSCDWSPSAFVVCFHFQARIFRLLLLHSFQRLVLRAFFDSGVFGKAVYEFSLAEQLEFLGPVDFSSDLNFEQTETRTEWESHIELASDYQYKAFLAWVLYITRQLRRVAWRAPESEILRICPLSFGPREASRDHPPRVSLSMPLIPLVPSLHSFFRRL